MQKLYLNKGLMLRLTADYVITLILLILAINFSDIVTYSVKRGFFCNDESLKYPYHEDTVQANVLKTLGFYMPIVLIILGESVLYLIEKKGNHQDNGLAKAFHKLHYNLTSFLCGFAMHAFCMHAGKIIIGRLRPHFFELCQPYRILDGSTCDNPKNHGVYIEDYECNTIDVPYISKFMIHEVHKSFPSGHSSYMFYGMIFLILYLQRFSQTLRQNHINLGICMVIVQMFCALLAWTIAVSRVTDNKHHWSDVLAGSFVGAAFAYGITLYACQQLKSVNNSSSCQKGGIKSSNSDTTSTTTYNATTPSTVLVTCQ